jgi:photosystem II stability/assembly factor-like uncharacterized protein
MVYIGTENGVYSSSDGGQSWFSMNDSLVSLDVKTLYMSPGNQLYAGTRGYGLYQWMNDHWMAHDGFDNWGQFWPIWNDRPKYQYTSLLIHPEDHSRMLLGTFPQGIYKSKDGGATWKERNIGFTNDGVFSLVCHPENPELVYAGTYNGMNRSLDFGDHWEMWDNGMPPEQWVFSIDFNPIDPDIMYACSKNGENEGDGRIGFRGTVMKSSDGGEHWVEITNGLVDKDDSLHQEFYNIIVDRFDPNTIYLTAEFGVYISRDGGGLWEPWKEGLINHFPGTNGNNVTHAFTLSADHSMLYFGSDGSGVRRRMITPILPVNKLSARVINHEVLLKWSFADLNNSFSHYNVYRDEVYFTDITGMTPVARITSMADTFYTDANIQEGNPYFYAVTTNDTSGYENDHLYVLGPVVDYLFQITSTALDSGMVGMTYSDTLEVIGGDPPYSWEILSGTLTDGLELSAAGIIQGIPNEAGQFQFTVRASDSRQPPNTDTLMCNLYIEESTGIETDLLVPDNFALRQNFPNPFSTTTMIRFELPGREKVQLVVCNFLGQKVDILLDKYIPAGFHEIEFSGVDLPPGIYFYKITAGNYQDVKKTLLVK